MTRLFVEQPLASPGSAKYNESKLYDRAVQLCTVHFIIPNNGILK